MIQIGDNMRKIVFLISLILVSCSNVSSSDFLTINESSLVSNETNISSSVVKEIKDIIPITSKELIEDPAYCQIQSGLENNEITTGFPISKNRASAIDKIVVQVIFIDFNDLPGTLNEDGIKSFFSLYSENIEHFYDYQSNGKLSFEWRVHTNFVRMKNLLSDYDLRRDGANSYVDLYKVVSDGVALSDDVVDYADTDIVIVFLNPEVPIELADVSPAWPMNEDGAIQTNEGKIYNATLGSGDSVRFGWSVLAHEFGHLIGLDDLYSYTNAHTELFVGKHDIMAAGTSEYGNNLEINGWSKYLLGWTSATQTRCLDSSKPSFTTHELVANNFNSIDNKLVLVKLTETTLLAIEVKNRNEFCERCIGGVYVYLIDSSIATGFGPIRLLKPIHARNAHFMDAYLSLNQEYKYQNITIKNIGLQNDKVVISIGIE